MSDIEIANSIELEKINDLLVDSNVDLDYVDNYGKYKAKIDIDYINKLSKRKDGKLILVTSINPTMYGEGKTTLAIGLCDAFNKIGKKATVTLREPSMGPVFGIKGGATGGGYSQVVPMEDINLHFTGDMHAITSANNLLCAIIDNHIFQGNKLNIEEVVFNRCLDVNDRALRNVNILGNTNRFDKFNITVASEIMAILCLASDFSDLKRRIAKIIVGYNKKGKPVYVSDLRATDAVSMLLKDAINPNVVQSLEHNICMVHGGPFANIAHGCSSVVSNKMALKMFSYVITEAGFGADLGAEKFLDIVCPKSGLVPNAIVINVSIRSLKHNGGCPKKEMDKLKLEYLAKGIENLKCHIENILKYSKNIVVALNKFDSDLDEEIEYVKNVCDSYNVLFDVSTAYKDGGSGAVSLAEKIISVTKKDVDYKKLYDEKDSIKNKIEKVCKEIYHAKNIVYSDKALEEIKKLEKLKLSKYPICIAKTQYSISDNKELLGYPKDYDIHVSDLYVSNGAEFIVVLMGNIMTMPGLGKESAYLNMKISNDRKISGLY